MTREEAKTWISIPKEKLKIIAQHLYKNFDVIKAYANGAEVEYFDKGKWIRNTIPSFSEQFEYRVKPSEKPGEEESYETWKPKFDQYYYFVTSSGYVDFTKNNEIVEDHDLFSFGNFFKTYKDAKIAAAMIREAIKNSKKVIDHEHKLAQMGTVEAV